MSGKRRHQEREAQREAMAQRDRLEALASGLAVDLSALAPHNSYSQPDFVERGYYVDKPFVCLACGISQTWSAAQQKWWYEIAKGDVFSTATLCRPCRQQERARQEKTRLKGGDPNPYKNAELLLAKIRSDIEPAILLAGYRLVDRNKRGEVRALFLDYSRSDDLFTLSWDQHEAKLTAELLIGGGAELQIIATVEFRGIRSTSDIEDQLAAFIAPVRSFLEGLGTAPPEPESR